MARYNAANDWFSFLSAGVNTTATSFNVQNSTGHPVVPFKISVGDEIMNVTGVSGNTLTVQRGREGTAGATHPSGARVENRLTAEVQNDMWDEIESHNHDADYNNYVHPANVQCDAITDTQSHGNDKHSPNFSEEGHGHDHSSLGGIGVNDHHDRLHSISSSSDHSSMTANRLIGRGSTSGSPAQLTASTVRGILNVADGANDYSLEVHNNDHHNPNFAEEGHNHDHANLTNVTANQHHNRSHSVTSLSDHGNISGERILGRELSNTGTIRIMTTATTRALLKVEEGARATELKNILINGDFRINQRNFDGNWIGISTNGNYGYDRWHRWYGNIRQVIEAGNFKPSTTYTISGDNVTTAQLTSPASGHWTITVPNNANNVQLEEGSVATPFEQRPLGLEYTLCQRYYIKYMRGDTVYLCYAYGTGTTTCIAIMQLPVSMRVVPTVAKSGMRYDEGGSVTKALIDTIGAIWGGANGTLGMILNLELAGSPVNSTDGAAGAIVFNAGNWIELDAEL